VRLLYRGHACCLKDLPDLLDLGNTQELRLVPDPVSSSRLACLALPLYASPISRRLRCRRCSYEEPCVVPSLAALERRRLLATNVEALEQILGKGTVGAEEGVLVPYRAYKLLPPNLIRLAFL
jgi:hypothetical protein